MNKVMLIGNVGKEPDVRYYDRDTAVAILSLATTERGYILQNGTQVPDRTEWHNVVLYKGLAKVVEKYVHKGDKLFVEGKIRSRSYDDKNGVKRYVTEIVAENMEMLSPKSLAGSSFVQHSDEPSDQGPSSKDNSIATKEQGGQFAEDEMPS